MSPSAAHNIKCMRSCFVSECNYLAAVASSRGALRVPSERRGQSPTFKPVSRGPKSNRVQIRRTCRVSGLRPTRSELQLNNLVDPLLTSWQPGYTQEHRRGAALQCVGTPNTRGRCAPRKRDKDPCASFESSDVYDDYGWCG